MKQYSIEIKGNSKDWILGPFYASEENVKGWRDDGLVIDEIVETIPYENKMQPVYLTTK